MKLSFSNGKGAALCIAKKLSLCKNSRPPAEAAAFVLVVTRWVEDTTRKNTTQIEITIVSSSESVWRWITAKNFNTCCLLPVTKLKIKRKLRTKKHMHIQSMYFVVRWVEGKDKTRTFPFGSFFYSVVSFLPLCTLLSFARSCCCKQNCLMKIYAVKKFQHVLFFSIRFDAFFLWILSLYSVLYITEFFDGNCCMVARAFSGLH